MCRIGDIILVEEFIGTDGSTVSRHPFIVIDDNGGEIQGMPFDFVGSMTSSFEGKEEEYKERKLSHEENLEITVNDGVKKDGYVKADQIHYFKKDSVQYRVVGQVTVELFNALMGLIQYLKLSGKLIINSNNLKK